MTTVTIPLDQNPDIAALVADKQPGDWVELQASIKAKDDQTLTLRLEKCDDCEKPDNADEDASDEADAETATTPEPSEDDSSTAKLAEKLAPRSM